MLSECPVAPKAENVWGWGGGGWGVGGGYPDYIGLECLRVHVSMRNAGVVEDHSVALKELELVYTEQTRTVASHQMSLFSMCTLKFMRYIFLRCSLGTSAACQK